MSSSTQSYAAKRLIALATFCVVCTVVVATPVIFLVLLLSGADSPARAPEPASDFEWFTGWSLPIDAQIIHAENTHSGFKNDGDYTLVVRVPPKQLQDWLSAADPRHWNDGPVPEHIRRFWSNPPAYDGSRYQAVKVSETDSDWHRGSVVIVNPDTGMIWIYAWKV